jgi:hypothetical protein
MRGVSQWRRAAALFFAATGLYFAVELPSDFGILKTFNRRIKARVKRR